MSLQLEFVKGPGFVAEIVRTNRTKTASVRVQEGKVSVVVPKSLTDNQIERLVTNKTRWIKEKLLLHRQCVPVKPKEYVSGECFTYLGKNYRLKVEKAPRASVRLLAGRLVVALPEGSNGPEAVRNSLTDWIQTHAEAKLREKAERYARIVGVRPSSTSIRSYTSRWGGCSASGDIQFNWKIIMAPQRVVDYVVVHELCHLRVHNHSPEFWKFLERVFPDYQDCREWLKINGRSLNV